MWRLFATLYLLIALYIITFEEITDFLVDNFFYDIIARESLDDLKGWLLTFDYLAEHKDPQEWEPLLKRIRRDSNIPVALLSAELQAKLYPQSISSLDERGVFFIDADNYELLYRPGNRSEVLHIGPLTVSDELLNLGRNIDILSYLLLAVVVFIWHLLLWRKLAALESMAENFGEGHMEARVSENFYSRVGNLNQSFNRMADRISQLLKQNRQLLHAVSHELRSPISRLRCVIDLVDTDVSKEKKEEYVNDMSEDLTELETLVDEILNYSYLESLNQNIQTVPRSLKSVLSDSLSKWKRETGADILLRCDETLFAEMDRRLFLRAIGNLVINASRYCNGVVEINIEQIDDPDSIAVHVDDDGPGIPDAEREGIFEPFSRPDHSRARETGGYGLGLAIASQIARQHRGKIMVSTSPLGGARLSLIIPKRG